MAEPIELWQLYTDNPRELEDALDSLPHLDDPTIRRHVIHLATANRHPDFHPRITQIALELLRQYPHPDAFGPLMVALHDEAFTTPEESHLRVWVARTLTAYPDDVGLASLIQLLDDHNMYTRCCAAETLGTLRDERAISPLIAALDDSQELVRADAAKALGMIGNARALPPLIRRLRDNHRIVRECAVKALGNIHDARAVDPLLPMLADQSKFVRAAAAESLGQLRDSRAVPMLIERLADDADLYELGRVCDVVADSLQAIGTAAARRAIKRWEKKRWRAWQ